MPTEDTLLLQDNLDIPLAFKPPDTFVLAQIRKREIFGVWRRGERNLDHTRLRVTI
jgi:hypothetical protein